MLSVCISSWHARSVHASVPYAYAKCTYQFLMRMFRVRISSWHVCPTCFEGTSANKLSTQISSWLVCSVHASVPDPVCLAHSSVPDPYAQIMHQFLNPDTTDSYACQSIRVRKSIFLIIFFTYNKQQNTKLLLTLTNSLKSYPKKFVFCPHLKKILLKNRLSICIRNFAALNEHLNMFFKILF